MLAELNETIGRLITQINRDTSVSSDPNAAKGHPQYSRLVELGDRALPTLLGNLKSSMDKPNFGGLGVHCVICALHDISGESPPISNDDRGKVDKIADRWVKWGEAKGLC